MLSFSSSLYPPHLPSFPTRRSSDLSNCLNHGQQFDQLGAVFARCREGPILQHPSPIRAGRESPSGTHCHSTAVTAAAQGTSVERSEEHTSELQSRVDLVCRLLLEKK